MDGNPVANFQSDSTAPATCTLIEQIGGELGRVGASVDTTISRGVVYDAKALLADVSRMVADARGQEAVPRR